MRDDSFPVRKVGWPADLTSPPMRDLGRRLFTSPLVGPAPLHLSSMGESTLRRSRSVGEGGGTAAENSVFPVDARRDCAIETVEKARESGTAAIREDILPEDKAVIVRHSLATPPDHLRQAANDRPLHRGRGRAGAPSPSPHGNVRAAESAADPAASCPAGQLRRKRSPAEAPGRAIQKHAYGRSGELKITHWRRAARAYAPPSKRRS